MKAYIHRIGLIVFVPTLFFSCSDKQGPDNIIVNKDCPGNSTITLIFANKTSQQQDFDINYYCNGVAYLKSSIQPNDSVAFQVNLDKNSGESSPPLELCDLTVRWRAEPLSSPFQVIYPPLTCYPGDRYRTQIDDDEKYLFQIIDKPPCEERNKWFRVSMENKLDTAVYLFLQSGNVQFYSPTVSQTFNPQCNPVFCCMFPLEIVPGDSYEYSERITHFEILSIGYEPQDYGSGNLITLFNPEEGLADSIVHVEIRGIQLDSLIVTTSN